MRYYVDEGLGVFSFSRHELAEYLRTMCDARRIGQKPFPGEMGGRLVKKANGPVLKLNRLAVKEYLPVLRQVMLEGGVQDFRYKWTRRKYGYEKGTWVFGEIRIDLRIERIDGMWHVDKKVLLYTGEVLFYLKEHVSAAYVKKESCLRMGLLSGEMELSAMKYLGRSEC